MYNINLIILKILAILLNIGDYITTIIGLRLGLKEFNPIIRFLLKYRGLFFIVKILLVSFLIINIEIFSIVIFAVIGLGWAVIHNYRIIRKRKGNQNVDN